MLKTNYFIYLCLIVIVSWANFNRTMHDANEKKFDFGKKSELSAYIAEDIHYLHRNRSQLRNYDFRPVTCASIEEMKEQLFLLFSKKYITEEEEKLCIQLKEYLERIKES